ncbi:MAG TPA: SsrA-binding protein SmpB [Phycisphaerae bacterium]|nr:SsrA-binding protein SmpB [Phycisphaerae bacterium]HNU45189.1 SsrA-binding protein SmpB [Phycisphaerae bacterium]
MKKAPAPDTTVCRNRRASHRFHVLEQLDCGIVLLGTEVKSLRERQASLEEAYARILDEELWLIGFHIAPYRHGQTGAHDPLRRRKLLLHARELRKLRPKVEQRGLTLVPLRVYFSPRGLAKVTLGLARGKSGADKRQDLKAREDRREMERAQRRRE